MQKKAKNGAEKISRMQEIKCLMLKISCGPTQNLPVSYLSLQMLKLIFTLDVYDQKTKMQNKNLAQFVLNLSWVSLHKCSVVEAVCENVKLLV